MLLLQFIFTKVYHAFWLLCNTWIYTCAFISTLADATILIGPTRRVFITVGFLGVYTTFSSLTLGDVLLVIRGLFPKLAVLVAFIPQPVLDGAGIALFGTVDEPEIASTDAVSSQLNVDVE